jgi:hypothetical protein
MEKQIEMSGKDFEKQCQSCPDLLAFNRQTSKQKDIVFVTCRLEQCIKPPEVPMQAKEKVK